MVFPCAPLPLKVSLDIFGKFPRNFQKVSQAICVLNLSYLSLAKPKQGRGGGVGEVGPRTPLGLAEAGFFSS